MILPTTIFKIKEYVWFLCCQSMFHNPDFLPSIFISKWDTSPAWIISEQRFILWSIMQAGFKTISSSKVKMWVGRKWAKPGTDERTQSRLSANLPTRQNEMDFHRLPRELKKKMQRSEEFFMWVQTPVFPKLFKHKSQWTVDGYIVRNTGFAISQPSTMLVSIFKVVNCTSGCVLLPSLRPQIVESSKPMIDIFACS